MNEDYLDTSRFFGDWLHDPKDASELYKHIKLATQTFEASLDEEHEVGMRLVSFGQTIQFYVTSIGCADPSLIAFNGILDDGSPVKLIQHISQISFLLMKMKRHNPSEPKHQIGFQA